MFVLLLLFTLFISECYTEETCSIPLNVAADNFIKVFQTVINSKGLNEIKIPDAVQVFTKDWYLFNVTGFINCSQGVVGELATVKRTGDITMSTNDNQVTIRTRVGLEKLGFRFAYCTYGTKTWSTTSAINGTVGNNSIDVQVTLGGEESNCALSFDHIKLDQFDRLKIDIGKGLVSKIGNKIIEWLSKYFRDRIIAEVNKALINITPEILQKLHLCSEII